MGKVKSNRRCTDTETSRLPVTPNSFSQSELHGWCFEQKCPSGSCVCQPSWSIVTEQKIMDSAQNLWHEQWCMFTDDEQHQLQRMKQTVFAWILQSDSNHPTFHKSTQYCLVVRSKACEQGGGAGSSALSPLFRGVQRGWQRMLHTHLASSTRATMPAARGADAEVPVWDWVQRLWRSTVTWKQHLNCYLCWENPPCCHVWKSTVILKTTS